MMTLVITTGVIFNLLKISSTRTLKPILFSIGVVLALLYPLITPGFAIDFDIFLKAAHGNPADYFYGQWSLLFIWPLAQLPYGLAWSLFNLLNIIGIVYAVHVFNGHVGIALTSYAFFVNFFLGQINGIYIGLVALFSVLIQYRHYWLAGLVGFFAISKWYIGVPLCIGVLYTHRASFKPVVVIMGCMIVYSLLDPTWLYRILYLAGKPNQTDSFSLWPYTLVLWIPVLYRPNFKWWVVTWVLTVPYILPHSFLVMTVFPVGIVSIFFYLPFCFSGWFLQVAAFSIYLQELYQMSYVKAFFRFLAYYLLPSQVHYYSDPDGVRYLAWITNHMFGTVAYLDINNDLQFRW